MASARALRLSSRFILHSRPCSAHRFVPVSAQSRSRTFSIMPRRILSLLLVLAGLGASALSTDLPSAWRAWMYSRAIDSGHSNILNYITLDREVFVHSQNHLADLRIIDDLGNELPYELRNRLVPPSQPPGIPATIRENSFVPGQFTQVLADLRAHSSFHNSIRVPTPDAYFINLLVVAASDDAHAWRIVKPRAPISRFRKEKLDGSQTIRYSENNARYLRLPSQEPAHQFPVTPFAAFSSPELEKNSPLASGVPLTALQPPDPN